MVETQKHGIPALFSCFMVGLGQLIKGEFWNGFSFFCAYWLCIIFGITLLIQVHPFLALICFLASIIIWIINIQDAYNN
jgi:hypothetical protein